MTAPSGFPVAPLGFTVFAIVHVLVCAAAIPMIAAVAERLGHRCPNVAAFVMASSPLLLVAAPAGHSNSDAVFGLVLALWLLVVRGSSFAAGAVLALDHLGEADRPCTLLQGGQPKPWQCTTIGGLSILASVTAAFQDFA